MPVVRRIILLLLVMTAPAPAARAQETPPTQPPTEDAQLPPVQGPAVEGNRSASGVLDEPSVDVLRSRINEATTDLPEASRAELIGLYQQSIDELNQITAWSEKIREYQAGIEEAPRLTEEERAILAELSGKTPDAALPPDLTLEQLNIKLNEAETELRSRQERVRELNAKAEFRADRRQVITELITQANKRLEKDSRELGIAPPASSSPRLIEARSMLLRLKKRAVEHETRAYDDELSYYVARSDLLAARRETALIELSHAQARTDALRRAADARRQADITEQRRQAAEDLRGAHPQLRALAEQNADYIGRRQQISKLVSKTNARTTEVKRISERLDKGFTFLQDNFRGGGTAEDIGPFMRRIRPDTTLLDQYALESQAVKREMGRIKLEEVEIEDALVSLIGTSIEGEVEAALSSLSETTPLPADELETLTVQVRELLSARRTLLEPLKKDLENYNNALVDLAKADDKLLARMEEVRQFISRHVLWIRSAPPIYATPLPSGGLRPLRPVAEVAMGLVADLRVVPAYYILVICMIIALLVLRRRLVHEIETISGRVSRARTDSFHLTIVTLFCTVMCCLPMPITLAFIGWRAREAAHAEYFSAAGAARASLMAIAALVFALQFVHRTCRAKGLADSHFRWDTKTLKKCNRYVRWLGMLLIPTLLVVSYTEHYAESVWRESIGRWCLLVALVSTAVCVWRFLRPENGLVISRLSRSKSSWIYRCRHVVFVLCWGAPVVLAGASVVGYHYTAVLLSERALFTLALWWLLLLTYFLVVRWVFVAQRRLALEQARKLAEAQPDAAAAAATPSDAATVVVEDPKLDLVVIGDQTRKLLSAAVAFGAIVGMWAIWIDILPALGFLDEIRWSYHVAAPAATATDANGQSQPAQPLIAYVTLKHIALAILSIVATYILAGNIPGLLEITILQRLPLDKGGRFAFTALVRYSIVVVGAVTAFGLVGIGWSNVQWLVTAVIVGLGFGLQEIFANFVSGIVLLFERPLRVGDVVTVGETSGTVTQIRMRATTIIDWDRKELIIPNKNFITGSVINWSLSDATLRLITYVGIAYGSDTDTAERLLMEAVSESSDVMSEPPPKVMFWEFGDSALTYRVHAFIPSYEYLLTTRHDLHKRIDAKFRKSGIEIAFPQRDIHIRSMAAPMPLEAPDQPRDKDAPQAR